jgi:hypothetical protein
MPSHKRLLNAKHTWPVSKAPTRKAKPSDEGSQPSDGDGELSSDNMKALLPFSLRKVIIGAKA